MADDSGEKPKRSDSAYASHGATSIAQRVHLLAKFFDVHRSQTRARPQNPPRQPIFVRKAQKAQPDFAGHGPACCMETMADDVMAHPLAPGRLYSAEGPWY